MRGGGIAEKVRINNTPCTVGMGEREDRQTEKKEFGSEEDSSAGGVSRARGLAGGEVADRLGQTNGVSSFCQ